MLTDIVSVSDNNYGFWIRLNLKPFFFDKKCISFVLKHLEKKQED
jgi:hypothetical protein